MARAQVRIADDWRQKAMRDPEEAQYALGLQGSGGQHGPCRSSGPGLAPAPPQAPPQAQRTYQLPPSYEDGVGVQYQLVPQQQYQVLQGEEQYTTLYAQPPGLYQQQHPPGLYQQQHPPGLYQRGRAHSPVAQLAAETAGLPLAEDGYGQLLYQGGQQLVGRLQPGQQLVSHGGGGALLVRPGQLLVLQGQQHQHQHEQLMVMLPGGELVQLQHGPPQQQ
jgi:hypothetical protein